MRKQGNRVAECAQLFLRVHTNARKSPPSAPRRDKWARYALVIDTETTVDTKQSLTFGFYRFCELQADGTYACQEEGIFHSDECDRESVDRLRKFTEFMAETLEGCPKELRLYSRSEFVEEVFWRACEAKAVVVGCNLAFDLARLAIEYRISKKRNTGWSLVLSRYYNKKLRKWKPNTYRPRVRINPKDSRDAFISLAGGDSNRPFTRGRFLNLLTLAWALRNERHSLKSACRKWRVKGKLDHKPTGRVTRAEINYCRQDVRATVNLLNAIRAEYETYPIALQPERAHSAASIAKAFLESMHLKLPAAKYSLPNEICGIAMQGYYGGRSEVRIRHATVPVVYCDFTSEYPTVNSLLEVWQHFVARKLDVRDATKGVRDLLRELTLRQLFNREFWPQLAFFALVKPDGDVLPVRTCYSETGETNIGLNPLTSKKPIWFAGPDLAASVLLTGRVPNVKKAMRVNAVGIQDGLKSTIIGNRTVNPMRDDFFRVIIETRKQYASGHPMHHFLKILANAGGYGMYAELNKEYFGKNNRKPTRVYSGEGSFLRTASTVEFPGPWYFPPVASLIPAGGRLLLAMLERAVADAGGTYMMCDTDSMAIVSTKRGGFVSNVSDRQKTPDRNQTIKALSWKEVEHIASMFAELNPYDREVVRDILKIEDYNFDREGNRQQLYGLAISAKRYALFTDGGEIIKPSEHGLGPYFHPIKGRYRPCHCKNRKDTYPKWIADGWRWILGKHRGEKQNTPGWFRILAMRKIAITTPNVLARLRHIDRESAKPYNFVLSPMQIFEGGPTLIAPFTDDSRRWVGLEDGLDYISVEDGRRFRLCRPDEDELLIWTPEMVADGKAKDRPQYLLSTQLRDFDQVFHEYDQHPESKSLAPDGSPCMADTCGLLRRRPIQAILPFRFIGKEVDRRAQDDVNVFSDDKPEEYQRGGENTQPLDAMSLVKLRGQSRRHLMRVTRLSQHAIERALRGEPVHPRTREKLLKVARGLVVA